MYNNLKKFVDDLNFLVFSSKSTLIYKKSDETFYIVISKNKICFNPIHDYVFCEYDKYVIYPSQSSFPFKKYVFYVNTSKKCIYFFEKNICFSWNSNYVEVNVSGKVYRFVKSLCVNDVCFSVINKSSSSLEGFIYRPDEISLGILGEDTPFFLAFFCENGRPNLCIYARDVLQLDSSRLIDVSFEPENQNIIYDKGYIYIYKKVEDDSIVLYVRFLRR